VIIFQDGRYEERAYFASPDPGNRTIIRENIECILESDDYNGKMQNLMMRLVNNRGQLADQKFAAIRHGEFVMRIKKKRPIVDTEGKSEEKKAKTASKWQRKVKWAKDLAVTLFIDPRRSESKWAGGQPATDRFRARGTRSGRNVRPQRLLKKERGGEMHSFNSKDN
jgi:hypothetical protein